MINKNILFLLCVLFSCTSNPLWNDPRTIELVLSGNVVAENRVTDVPISIWVETFDFYSVANEDGSFSIPLKSTQSQSGNISGPVNIYFFIHNYLLDSAVVHFSNGELSRDQTDFSSEGRLLKNIILKKLLSGNVEIHTLENGFYNQDTLLVTFEFNTYLPVLIDCYKFIWKDEYNFNTGLFFRSLVDGNIHFYRFSGTDEYGNTIEDQLEHLNCGSHESFNWDYLILIEQLDLPNGSYEVLPYFLIKHDYLPEGLVQGLGGESIFLPTDLYLDLPNDIETDTLTIF